MRRVSLTFSITLALVLTLAAAPVPRVPPDPTKDREGNPLPKGATARLGSLVLRGTGMSNLVFSADGKELYANVAGRFHRWSTETGRLYVGDSRNLRRFEEKVGKDLPSAADLEGHVDLMRATPDGKRLITRGRDLEKDRTGKVTGVVDHRYLLVRDMNANKVIGRLEIGARPLDFRSASNNAVIVLSAKYQPPRPPVFTVSRWNLSTFKRAWLAPPLPENFHRLAVSPDGKRFVASDLHSIARLYDAVTGKLLLDSSGHSSPMAWIGFAPDGESVITVARDGVRTWALNGKRKTAINPPEITGGHFYPPLPREHLIWVRHLGDGKKAELLGWDRKKGAVGWRMPLEEPIPERILSHDGKRCVGVSWNKAQRVWDVSVYDGPTGKKSHAWTLNVAKNGGLFWWPPLALSPDGETLFVGSKGISGLDATSGKEKFWLNAGEIEPDHTPAPFPMTVSPGGTHLALISRNQKTPGSFLRVFNIKTGKTTAHHPLGKVYHPSLRFAPNGKSVAIWNMWSPTVQICHAESSDTEPRKLEGGVIRATFAAFNRNGTSLVVGYQDGTALVWDLLAK